MYAAGVGKALGLRVNKDTFKEANLLSKEFMNQLKEKLVFCFHKKMNEEYKEIFPTPK